MEEHAPNGGITDHVAECAARPHEEVDVWPGKGAWSGGPGVRATVPGESRSEAPVFSGECCDA